VPGPGKEKDSGWLPAEITYLPDKDEEAPSMAKKNKRRTKRRTSTPPRITDAAAPMQAGWLAAEITEHPSHGEQPRAKSGRKPTRDWVIKLGAWLVGIAASEPKRLQNVFQLTTEAHSFLLEEIGWAPFDEKYLRKKILAFLEFIPRV
jgi:hypothetical protein